MKTKNNELVVKIMTVLAACVFLFLVISYTANLICQLNFYNTYIDDGFPANLSGESLVNRLMAEKIYGAYSIRFSSTTEPHFEKALVEYVPLAKAFDPKALGKENAFYSLEAQPYDVILDLRRMYPSDLASLSNFKDLSYFHLAEQLPGSLCIKHTYLIRNNKTNTNFFIIESHYIGT